MPDDPPVTRIRLPSSTRGRLPGWRPVGETGVRKGSRWVDKVARSRVRVARSGEPLAGWKARRPTPALWWGGAGATERRRPCSWASISTSWTPRAGWSCPLASAPNWPTAWSRPAASTAACTSFGWRTSAARQWRSCPGIGPTWGSANRARSLFGGASDLPLDAQGRLADPAAAAGIRPARPAMSSCSASTTTSRSGMPKPGPASRPNSTTQYANTDTGPAEEER